MGNFYLSVLQTHCKCNAMAIQWQCNGLHCYKSLKQKFIDISDMVKKNVTSVNIQQMPENLSANAEIVNKYGITMFLILIVVSYSYYLCFVI